MKGIHQYINNQNVFKNHTSKISIICPRGQWVNLPHDMKLGNICQYSIIVKNDMCSFIYLFIYFLFLEIVVNCSCLLGNHHPVCWWFFHQKALEHLQTQCWAILMPYINGLVQDCSISTALAMEILQSCTKLSIYGTGNKGVNIVYVCYAKLTPRVNSLWPSDAIWHPKSWTTLIQVMTCDVFGTKPLP